MFYNVTFVPVGIICGYRDITNDDMVINDFIGHSQIIPNGCFCNRALFDKYNDKPNCIIYIVSNNFDFLVEFIFSIQIISAI